MQEILRLLILIGAAFAALMALLTWVLVRRALRPPRHTAGYAMARGLPLDPGDLDLPFESWTLERPRGVTLPVWVIEARGRDRSAPTGVFIHGWGQSRIDMLARVGAWPEHLRRLVLYDLRGHGDAEGGTSRLGHGEDRDLLELIGRLEPGPVLLVGHSMGAVIAIAAAAREAPSSHPISGVVAFGPYLDLHDSIRRRIRGFGSPARPMSDLAMLWMHARGMRPLDPLGDAASMTVPLLVIQGEHDPVAPPDDADRLAAAAADATLIRVAGAGHLDAHAVRPDEVSDAIAAFVARVTERGNPGQSPVSANTRDELGEDE